MRKFSFREISKTLLLCTASLNLGFSSGLLWLGFAFAAAFVILLFRYDVARVPMYRKSIAYGLIVPFAFWWVLSPEVEYGVSPWLVFIPAYYLLSLAYLQKRSLGNGGYDVFVLFNGVAVLLLSCYQARAAGVGANFVALLLLVHAYGRPGVKLWKQALFLLLFGLHAGCGNCGALVQKRFQLRAFVGCVGTPLSSTSSSTVGPTTSSATCG